MKIILENRKLGILHRILAGLMALLLCIGMINVALFHDDKYGSLVIWHGYILYSLSVLAIRGFCPRHWMQIIRFFKQPI